MTQQQRIEELKKAALQILVDGDKFTLIRDYDSVKVIEDDFDDKRAKKLYNAQSILRRYINKHFLLTVGFDVFLFVALIFVFSFAYDYGYLSSSLPWYGVFIVFMMIYIYLAYLSNNFARWIYLTFKWNTIREEFKMFEVDSSFLQNNLDTSPELKNITAIMSEKLVNSEIKEKKTEKINAEKKKYDQFKKY